MTCGGEAGSRPAARDRSRVMFLLFFFFSAHCDPLQTCPLSSSLPLLSSLSVSSLGGRWQVSSRQEQQPFDATLCHSVYVWSNP